MHAISKIPKENKFRIEQFVGNKLLYKMFFYNWKSFFNT